MRARVAGPASDEGTIEVDTVVVAPEVLEEIPGFGGPRRGGGDFGGGHGGVNWQPARILGRLLNSNKPSGNSIKRRPLTDASWPRGFMLVS